MIGIDNIGIIIGIITIIIAFLLIFQKTSQRQPVTTNQQSETPTAAPPRKFPVKTIIGIVIVIAILGIIFLSPGDLGDKIEKAKSVIPREEKIPEIPMKCVIYITNFGEEARGEDRIKIGDYAETSVKNGKLIVKARDKDKSATIYIVLDKELQEKKTVKMECTVKVSGNGKSALGGYIEDSFLQRFTFNGEIIDCFLHNEMKEDPCNPGINNQQYKVIITRAINNDLTAEFRAKIISSLREKNEEEVPYHLFQKENLIEIGLDFYSDSDDGKDKLEISEIRVYASEN